MIRTHHILTLAALLWFALPATVGAQNAQYIPLDRQGTRARARAT